MWYLVCFVCFYIFSFKFDIPSNAFFHQYSNHFCNGIPPIHAAIYFYNKGNRFIDGYQVGVFMLFFSAIVDLLLPYGGKLVAFIIILIWIWWFYRYIMSNYEKIQPQEAEGKGFLSIILLSLIALSYFVFVFTIIHFQWTILIFIVFLFIPILVTMLTKFRIINVILKVTFLLISVTSFGFFWLLISRW
jgi:hypothetical protein